MRALPFIALLLWAPAVAAQQPSPEADADAFQSFIEEARPVCEAKPAKACVDTGYRFAASSPGQGLTLADVHNLRRSLGAWYERHGPQLRPREQGSVELGMLLADGMGMERLHAAFDGDRDGMVTQEELLADVKLDSRPLGEVLKDPAATDRAGLARRLGLPPVLLEGLFR
ncbi:MAG: hypothetical protein AB7P52_03940 [Alphaproteobacteria bacterium]